MICYEVIFPAEVREFTQAGAGVSRQHYERRLVRSQRGAVSALGDGGHAGRGERELSGCGRPTPA